MQLTILKSKIHNAHITDANVDYIGSITIDEELLLSAKIIEGEQVHVINHRNGERLITYVIKGKKGSGEICINGPAALKIGSGDKVIIISYASVNTDEAKTFKPTIVFPKKGNSI